MGKYTEEFRKGGKYYYYKRKTPELSFEEKFHGGYKPNPFNGCWEWQGLKDRHGYGDLYHKDSPVYPSRFAHRAAYALFKGPVPKGMCVCHKCDNTSCVNPDHLFLGTHKDNTHDMMKKGRHVPRCKEREEKLKCGLIAQTILRDTAQVI